MKQTRRASFVEAITNVAVGFVLSFAANYYALPLFGLFPTAHDAMAISGILTIISIIRSYSLRRVFEMWRHIF